MAPIAAMSGDGSGESLETEVVGVELDERVGVGCGRAADHEPVAEIADHGARRTLYATSSVTIAPWVVASRCWTGYLVTSEYHTSLMT